MKTGRSNTDTEAEEVSLSLSPNIIQILDDEDDMSLVYTTGASSSHTTTTTTTRVPNNDIIGEKQKKNGKDDPISVEEYCYKRTKTTTQNNYYYNSIVIDDDDDTVQVLDSSSSTTTRMRYLFCCEICAEERPLSESLEIMGCKHFYCSSCIVSYVSSKLQDNIPQIRCPVSGCNTGLLDPYHCRSILPQQLFDRWGSALCEAVILDSQKFYCPFKDCSALLLLEEEDDITQSECPYCRRLFCARCKAPWHQDIPCSEFQKLNQDDTDIMLLQLAQSHQWMRCPKCKFYVDKISGCSFVRCRCGHEFCYSCGAPTPMSHRCTNTNCSQGRLFREAQQGIGQLRVPAPMRPQQILGQDQRVPPPNQPQQILLQQMLGQQQRIPPFIRPQQIPLQQMQRFPPPIRPQQIPGHPLQQMLGRQQVPGIPFPNPMQFPRQ